MRRLLAAAEALALGRGGITLVSQATGVSRRAIGVGIRQLQQEGVGEALPAGRVRRAGGGRKKAESKDPALCQALEELIEPDTRGDPESPLRWTCKSVRRLAAELRKRGHPVSHQTVARLLEGMGYSLQGNRKTLEGASHPDRDAQFQYIHHQAKGQMAAGNPVISVDTKKKELVGRYKNGGRELRPKGRPEEVNVHDFGKRASPYGVYDLANNVAWVSVGIDRDTASFAVESIRRWWLHMGRAAFPQAKELLITADGGGSNGSRVRLWKLELQALADELGFPIHVCHLPPGTSKWNKIEHRLFAHITMNWRGKPLTSHEVIVKLIRGTTTTKGLKVRSEVDEGSYPTGRKVSEEEFRKVNITRQDFHGEWNYTISPSAFS